MQMATFLHCLQRKSRVTNSEVEVQITDFFIWSGDSSITSGDSFRVFCNLALHERKSLGSWQLTGSQPSSSLAAALYQVETITDFHYNFWIEVNKSLQSPNKTLEQFGPKQITFLYFLPYFLRQHWCNIIFHLVYLILFRCLSLKIYLVQKPLSWCRRGLETKS